jgi:hypothetical protein
LALQQIHFIYSIKENFLRKMHFDAKMVKFQNPVPCVAGTASLGSEFFAKCELLSGKGRQRHELCLALLKGLILSVNQSTSVD